MIIAARLEPDDTLDRRSKHRRRLALDSNIQTGEAVSIHDVSATGMLIETDAKLSPRDRLELSLPQSGITDALVVWNSGRFFGCEFTRPLSQATLSAALLRSTPIDRGGQAPSVKSPAIAAEQRAAKRAPAAPRLEEAGDELKWSLAARARFILGSSILLWALIIGAIVIAVKLFGRWG
jgi:hypothetical protein